MTSDSRITDPRIWRRDAPDRPQRRELARPLRHRDRERVEDDERADEEGDRGEYQQEVPEDGRELVHLVHLLRSLGGGAHDLSVGRKGGLEGRDELVLADAFHSRNRDHVELAFPIEELLGGRDGEDGEARVSEPVEAAVPCDPDERERALRLERRDLDGIADLIALVVRGADVDHDLVGRRGPAAFEDVERIELRELGSRVDPEPERRRALRADRFPLGREDLRVALVEHGAGGEGDTVDTPYGVEQRFVDRGSRRPLTVDRDLEAAAGHDRIRARVRLREEGLERAVDRVREDVCAADHRDAEDDRNSGQERAELAARETAESDPDHPAATSSMTERISCWLPSASSRTNSPSARKSTRCATAAARASWVTITIVWP